MSAGAARILFAIAVCMANSAFASETLRRDALKLFGRIEAAPTATKPTPEIELGRALFWDLRVSSDGKTACASCHFARDWGADRRRLSPDARGQLTSRHSPTVFNSMTQPTLRWLGDRKSGAHQAEGSLTGSLGFATREAGIDRLRELDYLKAFRAAYPNDADPLNSANYGRALEAYQASLTTPAPFDRFLGGYDGALTSRQQAGLRAFIDVGCAGCHRGALLGGTLLQKFGVTGDYWKLTGSEKPDTGRFAVTKKEEDRYVFRVPMLRNVARTAPYFHDGSVDRLDNAVRIMAQLQLGRSLDDVTVVAIEDFLQALTGEVPANYAPPGQQPDFNR